MIKYTIIYYKKYFIVLYDILLYSKKYIRVHIIIIQINTCFTLPMKIFKTKTKKYTYVIFKSTEYILFFTYKYQNI